MSRFLEFRHTPGGMGGEHRQTRVIDLEEAELPGAGVLAALPKGPAPAVGVVPVEPETPLRDWSD